MPHSTSRPTAAQVVFAVDRAINELPSHRSGTAGTCLERIRSIAAGRRDGFVRLDTPAWAADMGRDPSTVRAAIRWLVQAGFLVEAGVEYRFGGRSRLFALPCLASLFAIERAETPAEKGKNTRGDGGNSPRPPYRKQDEEQSDSEQDAAAAQASPPTPEEAEVLSILGHMGFGNARAILDEHGAQAIRDALELVRGRGDQRNPRGYLMSAIVGQWACSPKPHAQPERQPRPSALDPPSLAQGGAGVGSIRGNRTRSRLGWSLGHRCG